MRPIKLFATALMLAVLGCEEEKATGGQKPTKISTTPEYQLAVQNKRGFVAESDPVIPQFKTLLASLDAKYPEDVAKITSLSTHAHQMLMTAGRNDTLLSMMQAIDKAPAGGKNYETVVKEYLSQRMPPPR